MSKRTWRNSRRHGMFDWMGSHWFEMAVFMTTVLPSLITGLTPYPKAQGIVSALRAALEVLSWLTHRDAPGTFKLPGTCRVPKAPVIPLKAPAKGKRRPGFKAFCVALVALSAVQGCSWWNDKGKPVVVAC